jgi:hypothetical protein
VVEEMEKEGKRECEGGQGEGERRSGYLVVPCDDSESERCATWLYLDRRRVRQ